MNQETSSSTVLHQLGVAIGTATAVASATSWILLLLLTGSLVPRATLVAATLAVAVAVAAYGAVRTGQVWVLIIAASFGAIAPPDIGSAPGFFRYVGVLAIGFAVAAMFLGASRKPHLRVS